MESQTNTPPLVVIIGETASGKSEMAMRLAAKFDGEIIAADSWTVYREFNVGAAKPSSQDRARIPHHLIDVTNARAGFNAAEYKKLTLEAIRDIVSRNKLPILVGGTGLYVDSVIFDYSFLPAAGKRVREELTALDLNQLIQLLLDADIDISGIDLRNKRRLIRLLETDGRRPSRASVVRPNTLLLGIQISTSELRERVSRRVEAMMAKGLEREVKYLSTKYGWQVEPMKGIGYREFQDYFTGGQTLEQTQERIVSATMGLAKKQRTWHKRNKSIHWINEQAESVDLVTTFLNK